MVRGAVSGVRTPALAHVRRAGTSREGSFRRAATRLSGNAAGQNSSGSAKDRTDGIHRLRILSLMARSFRIAADVSRRRNLARFLIGHLSRRVPGHDGLIGARRLHGVNRV